MQNATVTAPATKANSQDLFDIFGCSPPSAFELNRPGPLINTPAYTQSAFPTQTHFHMGQGQQQQGGGNTTAADKYAALAELDNAFKVNSTAAATVHSTNAPPAAMFHNGPSNGPFMSGDPFASITPSTYWMTSAATATTARTHNSQPSLSNPFANSFNPSSGGGGGGGDLKPTNPFAASTSAGQPACGHGGLAAAVGSTSSMPTSTTPFPYFAPARPQQPTGGAHSSTTNPFHHSVPQSTAVQQGAPIEWNTGPGTQAAFTPASVRVSPRLYMLCRSFGALMLCVPHYSTNG